MNRRWQLALHGVVVCVAWIGDVAEAQADEGAGRWPEPVSVEQSAPPKPATFRVNLGLELMSGLGAGSTGPIAGPLIPHTSVSLEWRMRGPLWAFVRGGGGVNGSDQGAAHDIAWTAGGGAGIRLELPVLDWMDVGGHVLVGAAASRDEQRWNDEVVWGASSLEAAARLGLGAHLHPTSFFGTRLSLGLLDGGYRVEAMGDERWAAFYARVTAQPQVELTFSF